MMPDDLMNSVTKQQLMDVVEFLTTLKTSTQLQGVPVYADLAAFAEALLIGELPAA